MAAIGILINGSFVCIGSVPYLKDKYGTGYKITVSKGSQLTTDTLELIKEICPHTTRTNDCSDIYETFQVFDQKLFYRPLLTCFSKTRSLKQSSNLVKRSPSLSSLNQMESSKTFPYIILHLNKYFWNFPNLRMRKSKRNQKKKKKRCCLTK